MLLEVTGGTFCSPNFHTGFFRRIYEAFFNSGLLPRNLVMGVLVQRELVVEVPNFLLSKNSTAGQVSTVWRVSMFRYTCTQRASLLCLREVQLYRQDGTGLCAYLNILRFNLSVKSANDDSDLPAVLL